jgi:hypothetical protein
VDGTQHQGRRLSRLQGVVQSLLGPFTIKDRLTEDLAAATPLPKHRFEPCVIRPAVAVDKFQTVAFDGNRCSAPRRFAFEMATVKSYVEQVVIVAKGQIVASHLLADPSAQAAFVPHGSDANSPLD